MNAVDTQYSNNGYFYMYAQKLSIKDDTDKQLRYRYKWGKQIPVTNGTKYKGVIYTIDLYIWE